MSELLNEQLSALLDGELPPEETSLLLKRLGREAELAARLGRYRLCGDVLRGERVQPRADFTMRVSAAIALEPALAAPRPAPRRAAPWLRPLAGLAVAASVAVVAVLVLRMSPPSPGTAPATAQVVADSGVRPAAPDAAPSRAVLARGAAAPESYVTPGARPRLGTIPQGKLADYVLAHSQGSAPLARSVLIHLVADESRGDAPPP